MGPAWDALTLSVRLASLPPLRTKCDLKVEFLASAEILECSAKAVVAPGIGLK